jgi:glycerol-3-phosphate dehydrogenase
VIPVYADDSYPLWWIKFGLFVYDHLDWHSKLPPRKNLTPEDIIRLFPNIRREGLTGGCLYYDALMKDHRLVIENILSAQQHQAIVCNYTPVIDVLTENGRVVGLSYESRGQQGKVKAKAIVNATGAWSNHFLEKGGNREAFHVVPTKGVHLVIPEISSKEAILLRHPRDQRLFFLIPWQGQTLLGTTDTLFEGDPDRVSIDMQDRDYLLEGLKHAFPSLDLGNASAFRAFAGLRPLIGSNKKKPSLISRGHEIRVSSSGLINVLGGKFTTHRKMAQEAVDIVVDSLKGHSTWQQCHTRQTPLIGAQDSDFIRNFSSFNEECTHRFGLDHEQAKHLFDEYGQAARSILNRAQKEEGGLEQICPWHPHIMAEMTHAIETEHALELEDWFFRRTSIAYSSCRGVHCIERVSKKFAARLNWSESVRLEALALYLAADDEKNID